MEVREEHKKLGILQNAYSQTKPRRRIFTLAIGSAGFVLLEVKCKQIYHTVNERDRFCEWYGCDNAIWMRPIMGRPCLYTNSALPVNVWLVVFVRHLRFGRLGKVYDGAKWVYFNGLPVYRFMAFYLLKT